MFLKCLFCSVCVIVTFFTNNIWSLLYPVSQNEQWINDLFDWPSTITIASLIKQTESIPFPSHAISYTLHLFKNYIFNFFFKNQNQDRHNNIMLINFSNQTKICFIIINIIVIMMVVIGHDKSQTDGTTMMILFFLVYFCMWLVIWTDDDDLVA